MKFPTILGHAHADRRRRPSLWLTSLLMLLASPAFGQEPSWLRSNLIIPQSGCYRSTGPIGVELTEVEADVTVRQQVATTKLLLQLVNHGPTRQEATLLLPVPAGAVVREFAFAGQSSEPTVQMLPKQEAASIYRDLVARMKDPALLEFVGYNLVRSSVFPVEPGDKQWVRVTYEQILPSDGARVDYVLPRTELLTYNVPWKIRVRIHSDADIATVYSPSHPLQVDRESGNRVAAEVTAAGYREPGAFRLSSDGQRLGFCLAVRLPR